MPDFTLADVLQAVGGRFGIPQDWQPATPIGEFVKGSQGPQADIAMAVMGGPKLGGFSRVGGPMRPVEAPLFDYSRLSEVPSVAQFDLPRTIPPEGVPAATEALAAPKNLARVNEAVARGEAMGGREWYNTEPLRQEFVGQYGEGEGNRRFKSFMDLVAANSPRTKVPENIRNASYYYGQLERGDPIPQQYFSGGYWRIDPRTQAPSPYGIMPIHVQNMENVALGGLPVLGNQRPVTIDTHNMRLITRGAAEQPGAPEYGFLERMQQREAERMGLTPAQYQASAWLGAGRETGLGSPTEPFLRTLENRVAKTAEARGISKGEALMRFIRGEAPLL